jgi:hypothetical protein
MKIEWQRWRSENDENEIINGEEMAAKAKINIESERKCGMAKIEEIAKSMAKKCEKWQASAK